MPVRKTGKEIRLARSRFPARTAQVNLYGCKRRSNRKGLSSLRYLEPVTAATTTTVAQPAAAEPSRVGPWQLLRRIGEGQLACVYAARPVTHPADRPADYAVKIL